MTQICPICMREHAVLAVVPCYPFCSDTCKRADLFRWLAGDYHVARSLSPDELEEAQLPPDSGS